jgi:hypothetical protein
VMELRRPLECCVSRQLISQMSLGMCSNCLVGSMSPFAPDIRSMTRLPWSGMSQTKPNAGFVGPILAKYMLNSVPTGLRPLRRRAIALQ